MITDTENETVEERNARWNSELNAMPPYQASQESAIQDLERQLAETEQKLADLRQEVAEADVLDEKQEAAYERQLADKDAQIVVLAEALEPFVHSRWDYDLRSGARFAPGGQHDAVRKVVLRARAALSPAAVTEAVARYREALAVVERVKSDAVLLRLRNHLSLHSNPRDIAQELRAILIGETP